MIPSPPPQIRIHWVYDDPSGLPDVPTRPVL